MSPVRAPSVVKNDSPYLSVVVTARNDDHGGNLLGRMQAFVNGLLAQCARHRVPAELVMVEWNPPPDRPPLAEALDWSQVNEFCGVRIIEVPPDLHARFKHGKALPLYQMIAKNAGIRRARGEFILATNIDILFSDELFAILAGRALDSGKMYRADRWDVMPDVPVDQPIDRQLEWCNSHLLRVNRREGTFPLNPDGSMKIDAYDIVSLERGITLGENWFPREMSGSEPFRWVKNDAELIIAEAGDVLLSLDIEPGSGVDMEPFHLEFRDASGSILATTNVERRSIVTAPLKLAHANARVFLHTDYGGARIASDLRTLNFRVFRCERVTGTPATAVPAPPSASTPARLLRGWTALAKTFFSASEIRIPLSKSARERLNLRQDESAISFTLGPVFRSARVGGRVMGGLSAVWENGWYDFEHFRGETFRWMQPQAALTLILPEAGATQISLLVEAGPAVGFQGARLEIRDDAGELLAGADLRGRTAVDIPSAGFLGVAALHLSVTGGAVPRIVPGESRTLALRLIRCDVTPSALPQDAVNLFEAAPGAGAWCVRGFKQREDGLLCAPRAEMLLKTAEESTLRISTKSAVGRLRICDASGTVLYDGKVSPGQRIGIPPCGAHTLLRFSADRPLIFASLRIGDPDQPVRVDWSAQAHHPVHLHTNGCGDFTMLARSRWFDLRGYPEFDAFSMNIDSVLCWAAHHGGAREEILPARIFHIEHGTGSGWTPEGEQKLYQRIMAKGLPWLDFQTVLDWARAMHRFEIPLVFNHADWGFESDTLQETTPGRNACQTTKL